MKKTLILLASLVLFVSFGLGSMAFFDKKFYIFEDANVWDINGIAQCSGAQWLGADRACHAFTDSGDSNITWSDANAAFVPYVGAKYNVNLGSKSLATTGVVTGNAIRTPLITDINGGTGLSSITPALWDLNTGFKATELRDEVAALWSGNLSQLTTIGIGTGIPAGNLLLNINSVGVSGAIVQLIDVPTGTALQFGQTGGTPPLSWIRALAGTKLGIGIAGSNDAITISSSNTVLSGDLNVAKDVNTMGFLTIGNGAGKHVGLVAGDVNVSGKYYGDGSALTNIGMNYTDLNKNLVPYVGATIDVNLASKNLNAQKIITSGPQPKFQITSDGSGTKGYVTSTGTDIAISDNADYNGTDFIPNASVGASQISLNRGFINFNIINTATFGTPITWQQAMKINNNANVQFDSNKICSSDPNLCYDLSSINSPSDLNAKKIDSNTQEREEYGKYNLANYRSKIAKILNDNNGIAVIDWIGDSWAIANGNGNGEVEKVRRDLQKQFGDAGIGFVNLYYLSSVTPGVAIGAAGTWVTQRNTETAKGINLSDVTSTDTATPGRITVTGTATTFIIHYFRVPGGGIFQWDIDGGADTNVNTANATLAFGTVNITGLTNASHTLTIRMVTAGTTGVSIGGVELKKSVPSGIIISNLGSSGSDTNTWTIIDQNNWKAGINATNPDLVFIALGTNDMSEDFNLAYYKSNIQTMINNIKTAAPLSDIVLIAPADNNLSGHSLTMKDYAYTLQDLARENETGYIDLTKVFDNWSDANARGLMANANHPNDYGYQVYAEKVKDFLNIGKRAPIEYGYDGNATIINSDINIVSALPSIGLTQTGSGTSSNIQANGTNLLLLNNARSNGTNFYPNAGVGASNITLERGYITLNTVAAAGSPITWIEAMRIISDGNIGIGTTTPNRKLQINGDINATTYYGNGSNLTPNYTDLNKNFLPITSTIDANIGRVQIVGNAPNTLWLRPTNSTFGESIIFKEISASVNNFLIGHNYNVVNGFEITPSTAAGGTSFTTPALFIKGDGNVGIGTTTPSSKLRVTGDINASGKIIAANANTSLKNDGNITLTSPDGTKYNCGVANGGSFICSP